MTTTNIGPCNCCGGGEVCTCSGMGGWEYTAQGWEVVVPCATAYPCCQPSSADTISPFWNPSYYLPPVPLGATFSSPCYGTNGCYCTTCILTWDGFTESWSVTTGCSTNMGSTLHSACNCPEPGYPGTSHGETVSIACGCP